MSHATQLHNRGYLDDSMQSMNSSPLPGHVHDEVYGRLQASALATVQWSLAQAVDEEGTASLGCARSARPLHRRRPAETRSGVYERQLWTPYGWRADLRVPKLRRGNRHLSWPTIARSERCWGPFLAHPLRPYGLGPRRRELPEALCHSLGEFLALAACTRLVLGLEERAHAFKTARVPAPPPMVLVDGLGLTLAVPTGAWPTARSGRRRALPHKPKRVRLPA
jgi:hypothetical protein